LRSCSDAPLPDGGGSATHAFLDNAFRNERTALVRYLRREVGPDAASDLAQEVFCRAAGSAQADKLQNPIAFLRRIARNLLVDRHRREQRTGIALPFDEARDAACEPSQEHAIEAADLLRLYEKAVAGLPEKTRTIFLLHRVEERSYREIHELLEISTATVEYHMMKALAHIARVVEPSR
jgi:RNA polymerase sigma-70 factor (ECF subfamily)